MPRFKLSGGGAWASELPKSPFTHLTPRLGKTTWRGDQSAHCHSRPSTTGWMAQALASCTRSLGSSWLGQRGPDESITEGRGERKHSCCEPTAGEGQQGSQTGARLGTWYRQAPAPTKALPAAVREKTEPQATS